jgi:3'-phosphoadenosine 5'-phosphosulfate sulfotransferase (PAPS reductase)/FAD synthetase
MISDSLDMLRRIRDAGNPEIIVAISGGKDSLCVVDLCSRIFTRLHGFFLYFLKGLESEEQFLRLAESRYGITIHRLPGPGLATAIRYSRLRRCRPELEDKVRRDLKWADIERIMRQRTGANWIAYGHRMIDTLQRRAMLKSHEGVLEKHRRIYPIWDWAPCDVFSHLRTQRIPTPPMFGALKHKSSGLAPDDVKCLFYLQKHFPRDFARVIAAFPHATDLMFRDELRARYEIEQNAPLPAGVEE